jgi:hypothetical protein
MLRGTDSSNPSPSSGESAANRTSSTRRRPGLSRFKSRDLLRRYWWPIAGAIELENAGTLAVRLMGEDLVLYKDLGGKYGLIDRHCRHRRADLVSGSSGPAAPACSFRANPRAGMTAS